VTHNPDDSSPYGIEYSSVYHDPFAGLKEAPSSIDRSSAESVQDDAQRLVVGETLKFDNDISLKYGSVQGEVIAPDGSTVWSGIINPNTTFVADQAGEWTLRGPGGVIDRATVHSGNGNDGEETTGSPDDWTNVDNSDAIDPSEYAGIVNADNDEAVALAPALRREGAELGPEGATVQLPDGESVDVGAIQDEDEVARVIEGDNAGDVIDADQPAVDGDPSSEGSGSGVIGAVGAGILLVLAAAAALLGGGDGGE